MTAAFATSQAVIWQGGSEAPPKEVRACTLASMLKSPHYMQLKCICPFLLQSMDCVLEQRILLVEQVQVLVVMCFRTRHCHLLRHDLTFFLGGLYDVEAFGPSQPFAFEQGHPSTCPWIPAIRCQAIKEINPAQQAGWTSKRSKGLCHDVMTDAVSIKHRLYLFNS